MSIRSWFATKAVNFLASNNRTEGWETSLSRARPSSSLVSNDQEYNYGNREKMMAEARALCQTFGIASNILGKYANYCVGSCEVDFNTGNPDWDELAEETVRQLFETIDVSGENNLAGMAKMGIKSKKRDGDVGFIKTLDNGFPQIQAIEADRIRANPFPFNSDFDKTFIGGVKVGRTGRPLSFKVWERQLYMGFENPREIEASSFIFLKEKSRFDGIRGVTAFERGALNHMRDIKEIIAAEKKAVKVAGKWAVLIKRFAGGKPVSSVNLFGPKTDGTGNNYSEEVQDGLIKYLLPGEDASSFQSNRPSPTFQGFLEFLIRDIAVSLELPVGFVWSLLGLTGPSVRLESKQAEKTFQAEIEQLERTFLNPLCAWVITWAMMESKRLPFNPYWYKFEFNRPSHPSIDVGRESKADLDELAACVTSEVDLSAERGRNAFRTLKKKARFAQAVLATAKEFGVPVEMLKEPPKQQPPAPQQQEEP